MNREVELGSLASVVLNSNTTVVYVGTVLVTLFPTTVERASCKVHKLP